MSRGWRSRGSDEQHRLANRFAELTIAEYATDVGSDEAVDGPTFQRFYDAALREGPIGAALAASLLADAALRADFDLLLERTARYRLPRAAVASSGELDRREAGGLVVSLVASRANPAQVYVLIDAGGDHMAEAKLVVKTSAGEYLKESLPAPVGGTVRLLKSSDDPFTRALRDPASEVFLL